MFEEGKLLLIAREVEPHILLEVATPKQDAASPGHCEKHDAGARQRPYTNADLQARPETSFRFSCMATVLLVASPSFQNVHLNDFPGMVSWHESKLLDVLAYCGHTWQT